MAPSTYTLLSVFLILLKVSHAQVKYSQWFEGRATFYGEPNGYGTEYGACGYRNVYQIGIGIYNAAAASVLWKGGFGCGGCFQIKCNHKRSSRWCYPGKSVTITVTNMCPRGGLGWCNPPNRHFDMSVPSYLKIAQFHSGIVPTIMRRVPCQRKGPIKFHAIGNPWFFSVIIFNVGGNGEIYDVQAQADKPNAKWWILHHNWGAVWSVSKWFYGVPVNIRLRSGSGKTIFIKRAFPPGWSIGSVYGARGGQFFYGQSRRRKLATSLPASLASQRSLADAEGSVEESEVGRGSAKPVVSHPYVQPRSYHHEDPKWSPELALHQYGNVEEAVEFLKNSTDPVAESAIARLLGAGRSVIGLAESHVSNPEGDVKVDDSAT